jgi:hypothetical protein
VGARNFYVGYIQYKNTKIAYKIIKRREFFFSKIFVPLNAAFPYQLQQGQCTYNVAFWGVRVITAAKEIL